MDWVLQNLNSRWKKNRLNHSLLANFVRRCFAHEVGVFVVRIAGISSYYKFKAFEDTFYNFSRKGTRTTIFYHKRHKRKFCMTLKTFATFVFKFFSQKRKEVKDGFVFKMKSSKEIECSPDSSGKPLAGNN